MRMILHNLKANAVLQLPPLLPMVRKDSVVGTTISVRSYSYKTVALARQPLEQIYTQLLTA